MRIIGTNRGKKAEMCFLPLFYAIISAVFKPFYGSNPVLSANKEARKCFLFFVSIGTKREGFAVDKWLC